MPHRFPTPHHDVLEQYIPYRVPVEKFSDLAAFDGSVLVDRTKGEISARCEGEEANFLALNLANDIVEGRKDVQSARAAYGEAMRAMSKGETPEIMRKLLFAVSRDKTGELDEGRATITDGDTLKIGGQRIRLHGIDAPESRQSCQDVSGRDYSCGRDATRGLTSKTSGKHVSCQQRDVDRYGRIVAVCLAGDVNLNHWMVAQGWAVAYTRYSWAYLPAEVEARVAERGIWAGDFTTPEEWRRSNR